MTPVTAEHSCTDYIASQKQQGCRGTCGASKSYFIMCRSDRLSTTLLAQASRQQRGDHVKLVCWTMRTASAHMWEHVIPVHQPLVVPHTTAACTLSTPLGPQCSHASMTSCVATATSSHGGQDTARLTHSAQGGSSPPSSSWSGPWCGCLAPRQMSLT